MAYLVGAYSDRGQRRPVDQDACCFLEASTSIGTVAMAIVCDGVGGFSSGELASTTVIERFISWFESKMPVFLLYNATQRSFWTKLQGVWDDILQEANENIETYGAGHGTLMGTTFTGMLVYDGMYLIAHVGDCRAYEIRFSDGKVTCSQLTKDQTVVAQEVEAGRLTVEEAACHPERNVILQAVGTQDGVDPSFITGVFHDDSVYLICCDGFYSRLSLGEIADSYDPRSILADPSQMALYASCVRLSRCVMERGENDNITALAFGSLSSSQLHANAFGDDELESDYAATVAYYDDGPVMPFGDVPTASKK